MIAKMKGRDKDKHTMTKEEAKLETVLVLGVDLEGLEYACVTGQPIALELDRKSLPGNFRRQYNATDFSGDKVAKIGFCEPPKHYIGDVVMSKCRVLKIYKEK